MIRTLRQLAEASHDAVTPFLTKPVGRRFRLLIDTPTIEANSTLELLVKIADQPEVECWLTTRRGERWVQFDLSTTGEDHIAVELHAPDAITRSAVYPASVKQFFAERMATEDLSVQEALRQLVCTEISVHNRFDMFVSDSRELLRNPQGLDDRANVRSSKEALGLLSLFLRSRNVIDLGDDRAFIRNRFWFYLVSSRAVLPASGRWFSGCQLATGPEDLLADDSQPPTLRELGQTCMERVNWAIQARDHVLSSVADYEIPFYFDMFLLQMSAAFDALAQVTSMALRVQTSSRSVSWRSERWLGDLGLVHLPLATMMAEGEPHRDALNVIALLRNSIHESGLPMIGVATAVRGPTITTVRTPRGEYASRTFNDAIQRLGGADEWGVRTIIRSATTIDPLIFVDHALVSGLKALNGLMEATPVESFSNVDPENLRSQTQLDNDPNDPWSNWSRERILLLLGLEQDL